MKTLIELYAERPIENVLATEIFRPETTVILCPTDAENGRDAERIREFLAGRGLKSHALFLPVDLYDAMEVHDMLIRVMSEYPDCVLDITGGTDAALFAGGLVCSEHHLPVFTYSRRKNRFFDIHRANFVGPDALSVAYRVSDCFSMAGGVLAPGRADQNALKAAIPVIPEFFGVFLKYHRDWPRITKYIQMVSQPQKGEEPVLTVSGKAVPTTDHKGVLPVPRGALRDLSSIGLIRDLRITDRETVSFAFKNQDARFWLRDPGSVLEIYVWNVCRVSGLFSDVQCSAVVNWEADRVRDAVSNEIDVVAVHGIIPLFISCKNCSVSASALNELAVLRDRFGGHMSKALLVTTGGISPSTRHRAEELHIRVCDLKDLTKGGLTDQLYGMFPDAVRE